MSLRDEAKALVKRDGADVVGANGQLDAGDAAREGGLDGGRHEGPADAQTTILGEEADAEGSRSGGRPDGRPG